MSLKLYLPQLVVFMAASPLIGQTAALGGRVTDQTGAVIAGAKVILTNQSGSTRIAMSASDGIYAFSGLAPGDYVVQASAPNLTLPQPVKILLKPGATTLALQLNVVLLSQQVTVQANAGPRVGTAAENNASGIVLRGSDLQALADDPEDLMSDLQALAGPSAGPSGGSIYIDGFSTGELPSKDAIREIRINQNPFSPEYDKLGYGRIEILTKPGANKFHGTGYYNFGDSFWNSRNPYAAQKAPFLLKEYGGSLEGPLGRGGSFFLTVDRAAIDNGAIINGITLDPATLAIIDPFTQVFRIPQRRIRISPRIDYQLTPNDTLSVRYGFSTADIRHSGVGSFNLVSTGVHNYGDDHTAQVANTIVLGSKAINETRFQFYRAHISSIAEDSGPALDVLGSFIGGGAQVGSSFNLQNNYEIQNNTTISHGRHNWRFGIRVLAETLANTSPVNFGGTFIFAGGLAPELDVNDQPVLSSSGQPVLVNIDSIESYRRTLVLERMGLSADQTRTLGGGASQFTINAGNPALSVNQEDVGAFVGDDWRARPNLNVNAGLRYETQTNIHDGRDFAPRLGLAWAPGARSGRSSPKSVIRAGFGVFYDRFDITNSLTAERYNGIVQQQYVITNPNFFPSIPPVSSLSAYPTQRAIEKVSANIRAPYLMESAVAFERQLAARTTVAITFVDSHGLHEFRSSDINAPLPGTYNPQVPGSGVFSLGNPNPVFLMESSGLYNQTEVIGNFRSQPSKDVSLFGSYVYNVARSNTDYAAPASSGDFNPAISNPGGGLGTLLANPYSMAGEYGPAATDIRQQVTFGGSVSMRWGFRLNPLLTANSGAPFDITVGHDLYGDTLFNGRPGLALDPNKPGVIQTQYGLLDPNPSAGETILPRNHGHGPGILMFNLRLSKTFAFGPAGEGGAAPSGGPRRGSGGPFGLLAPQGGPSSGRRYNLTVSLSMRNLLNRNNPGPIVGNIESPLFGRANQPYGVGTLGGTSFSESADNRRLELQTRFTF